jgi:hypothetical protein
MPADEVEVAIISTKNDITTNSKNYNKISGCNNKYSISNDSSKYKINNNYSEAVVLTITGIPLQYEQ